MSFQQLVTPNPNIKCWPGMCLQYVRQAFDAPLVEPTATEGWNKAKYKHADRNFPDGVWVPLWFAIPGIAAGHVALRAPDGSVYSTSDNSNTPHHHPSLDELIWYYGPRVQPQYQLELQYLGWSEDISTVRVVQEMAIQTESTTTIQEDDMDPNTIFTSKDGAKVSFNDFLNSMDTKIDGLPKFDAQVREQFDGVRDFIRDVRADLEQKGQQISALAAANGQLVELLAQNKGLTIEEVQQALNNAVLKVTISVEGK